MSGIWRLSDQTYDIHIHNTTKSPARKISVMFPISKTSGGRYNWGFLTSRVANNYSKIEFVFHDAHRLLWKIQWETTRDDNTKLDKKLCYLRRARRAMSVKILSAAAQLYKQVVGPTRNPQIAVMELEGYYSWSTCIKQPRLVDCRIGVVNKLDRRRRRRRLPRFVDNAIDLPWRNFLRSEFGAKFQREVPLFSEVPEFPYNTV